MKMSGAELVMRLLEREGIKTVAGIPGGTNLPLYDALGRSTIRHILARHEQGAGFIAQGIARSTGETAVALATSGPGATNLLTAIADAKLDSVPVVFITGQVATALIGSDAFQEIDIYGMTVPVTKHNFLVRDATELLHVIPAAFQIAREGRPGPVLVDIPKDVQNALVEFNAWPEQMLAPEPLLPSDATLRQAADMIASSERPVIYAGAGCIGASADLARLARANDIPVATTLLALGSFPPDDPLFLGMPGMHAAPYANLLMDEADLVIACGARFDDRATGDADSFCRRARVIHVDIDHAELDKIRRADIPLRGDAVAILRQLAELADGKARTAWRARVEALKRQHPLPAPDDDFHPLAFLPELARQAGPDAFVTTDVGQHQMWTAQCFPVTRPRMLLTSGGLGTMGFGLPAAIGAALAHPGRTVLCVTGDGSLLMNIQELATLAELGLDVKIVVCNNGHLGLVRQQQELFYEKRYVASRFIANPDFVAIARGFGIAAIDAAATENPAAAFRHALATRGPALVNVPVQAGLNVLPMVAPGAANTCMIGV